jgi:hypothetical protein
MHWVAGELISAVLILFGIPIPLGRWIANLFRPADPFSALAKWTRRGCDLHTISLGG